MATSSELRTRRKLRQRYKIRFMSSAGKGKRLRLSVHRTNHHIYAQIIDDSAGKTILAASTMTVDAKKELTSGGNKEAAAYVGKEIAKKALEKGIDSVVFDRSGFLYHGRIKCLAEAARETGLVF